MRTLSALPHKDIEELLRSVSPSELARLAFSDGLTGLANYRFFMMRLREEALRIHRYPHVMSLILLDVDHFKKFNDTHGHVAGNEALAHLAMIITNCVRDTDIAARYGGEEFAIILPETNKREAAQIALRVCRQIETSPMEQRRPHTLTASAGVATLGCDTFDHLRLIELADSALYASKKEGRNRITSCALEPNVRLQHRAEAKAVSVVGSFNKWDPGEHPMREAAPGLFSADLGLAPGRYEYKFVVDGKYIPDPGRETTCGDGYGGVNSVLTVAG